MATIQELADEAFADLLRKHGIPVDLRDALSQECVPFGCGAGKKSRQIRLAWKKPNHEHGQRAGLGI